MMTNPSIWNGTSAELDDLIAALERSCVGCEARLASTQGQLHLCLVHQGELGDQRRIDRLLAARYAWRPMGEEEL